MFGKGTQQSLSQSLGTTDGGGQPAQVGTLAATQISPSQQKFLDESQSASSPTHCSPHSFTGLQIFPPTTASSRQQFDPQSALSVHASRHRSSSLFFSTKTTP